MTVQSLISKFGKSLVIKPKATGSIDASGGSVESFGTTSSVNAFVQVRSVSDDVSGGAERSTRRATIYFDGKPTITVKDRILYDSTTWEISSVRIPQERTTSDALCFTIVEAVEVFG